LHFTVIVFVTSLPSSPLSNGYRGLCHSGKAAGVWSLPLASV